MPVIVPAEEYGLWLDPAVQKPSDLEPVLQPFPPEELTAYAVSPIVNSPRHDVPACVERVED
jgi:putative SOS response-associated peptidase YedK